MLPTPLGVAPEIPDMHGRDSVPDSNAHDPILLLRNSKHRSIHAHFSPFGADCSLLHPASSLLRTIKLRLVLIG